MRISDLVLSCLRSLFRRKVRTILTIVGVLIGTCAIVVTLSLGEGMRRSQMEMISEWTDLTTVKVYRNWYGEDNEDIAQLNDAAVDSFQSIEHVKAVSPVMDLYNIAVISAGKYEYNGELRAVNLSILEDMGYELTDGELLNGESAGSTVYFGEQAAYNFTDTEHPDRYIDYEYDEEGNIISDPPFDPATSPLRYKLAVAGDSDDSSFYYSGETAAVDEQTVEERKARVEEKKLTYGGTLKGSYSQDDGYTYWAIYIDIELAKTLQKEYNELNGIRSTENGKDPNAFTYDEVIVKVDDMENVDAVEELIKGMGFSTYSFETEREPLEEQTRQIQLLFGGLGAISMLVAAIGIANTMVMSIYERTREIGVMKVLGCDLNNIRMMFLLEAGMIGLIGGITGTGLSFVIGAIINIFAGEGSYTSVIPLWLVLLGLGFSFLVGIVSGFSPANRAVKISALSAIRQE